MPTRPPHLFTAAFVRTAEGWSGAEVDLSDAEIADDLGDLVQEALGEALSEEGVELAGDELTLLCAEMEDEWFAIVRYEGDQEPRVFLSDVQAGAGDRFGQMFTDLAGVAPDKEGGNELGVRPVGDLDLLGDLGVSREELMELSMEEGVLPADTLSVIAERLGFAEEFDRLR